MEEAGGEEEEGEEEDHKRPAGPSVDIQQKKVPDAVFGSISVSEEEKAQKPAGALARLKAKRGLN